MNYGYVNPTNVSDIEVQDLDGTLLDLNGRPSIAVRLPIEGSGINSRSFQLGEDVVPEFDVYARTLDEAALPGPRQYYTPVDVLAFRNAGDTGDGTVKDPTSQVVQTRTWAEIPIDDLLTTKLGELQQFTDAVFFSSFQMDGGGGDLFWVNNSLRSQMYRFGANSYYQWTPPDPGDLQLVDGTGANVVSDSGSPWRNVPVWLVRVSNNNSIRTKADQVQWTEVQKKGGKFGFDTAYASDDVEASIELAHDADDWAALAAIDVTADPNATNPWPAHSFDAFNGSGF